jgi:hypothetical protein
VRARARYVLYSNEQLVAEFEYGSFTEAATDVDVLVVDYFAAHVARFEVSFYGAPFLAQAVLGSVFGAAAVPWPLERRRR